MEQWCRIRQRVLREGVSIRQIQRETGLHFDTIKKVLAHSSPPAFQCPDRPQPKIGPYLERISEILEADKERPKKQRHTAKRIFERIREEGYTGGDKPPVVPVQKRRVTHRGGLVFETAPASFRFGVLLTDCPPRRGRIRCT